MYYRNKKKTDFNRLFRVDLLVALILTKILFDIIMTYPELLKTRRLFLRETTKF